MASRTIFILLFSIYSLNIHSFDIENATEITADQLVVEQAKKKESSLEASSEGKKEEGTQDSEEVELTEEESLKIEKELEAEIEKEVDEEKKEKKKQKLLKIKKKKKRKKKYSFVRELKLVNPESIKFWNRGQVYSLIYYNYSRRDQHMENVFDKGLLTIKYKGDKQRADAYVRTELNKMKYVQNEAIDKKKFINFKIDKYSEIVDISYEKPPKKIANDYMEYKSFQNKISTSGKKVMLLEDKVDHLIKTNTLLTEESIKQKVQIKKLKESVKELKDQLLEKNSKKVRSSKKKRKK
jgi:hypothetical protein